ncbi:MAG TPA: VIT domain-containing protein [Gemmatimonadaceae bacterium]|nr:VIT domain-containing protein [Gemmatimonadaceae bacterium]
MRFPRSLAVALFVSSPAAVLAQGWVLPRPCGPEPRCGPRWPAVVRTESDVRVELRDRVLRYEVTETFVNRGAGLGEADYFFPLPKGAAFQDLKLEIDGELVSGETMSADRARAIYEEIVRKHRDPALVEWMGYGLLRTRIFPIAAGEEKKVVVRFHVVAEREGDALRVDYFRGTPRATPTPRPLQVERQEPRRRGHDEREHDGGHGGVSFTLLYPSGAGLGAPYSPTHSLRVSEMDGRRVVRVRGSASEVTILLPLSRNREPSITVLTHAPAREDGFALITVAPPAVSARATPRDVTFVLDVSGSMSGRKMEQARAAGKQLLSTLDPRDRFRVIAFSSGVDTFRDDFAAATRANIDEAHDYLDDLKASGGTNIAGALREALDVPTEPGRLPLVLFVTDGEPTVGERDPQAIASRAAELRGRRRVFTFGLGADVNVALLEQLALQGRGTAHFVRPQESVERAVEIVASRLTNPVVTDVRIRSDGIRLSKMHPVATVDLFAGQDLVILARYEGSGRGSIRLEGESGSGPVRWTATADFPERERGNSFIPRLWATQRIGWLSAEKRRGPTDGRGSTREIDDEIRELGERYGIPTEFTSYLVQEPTAVTTGEAMQRHRRDTRPAPVPSAAPTDAGARFESAKRATEQRAAVSLEDADAAGGVAGAGATGLRRAGNRVFTLRDGIWTDSRHRPGLRMVRVQAYSEAYFAVLDLLPELREAFAVGDRVVVVGPRSTIAMEVAPDGQDELSERDMEAIRSGW